MPPFYLFADEREIMNQLLENTVEGTTVTQAEPLDCVIPAWSAGIQIDIDVSGASLRTWMPAIHAGMTKIHFSCSAGEHTLAVVAWCKSLS